MDISYDGMHGAHNSFVLINDLDGKIESEVQLDKLAIELCSREKVDGAIYLKASDGADFKMRIFNPDGSEAEMCGNGIRCLAVFVRDHGLVDSEKINFETMGGPIMTEFVEDQVKVNMGVPKILKESVNGLGSGFNGTIASIGNPHFIMFFDQEVSEEYVNENGPILVDSDVFSPNKTNVEFATIKKIEDGVAYIDLKVWERGAGFTQACGTGAATVAFVANKLKNAPKKAIVSLPGGDLKIEIADSCFMTGPTAYLFKDKKINLSEALA